MRRRAFLASSSVILGASLAGCLDRDGGSGVEPLGETESTDGAGTSTDQVALTATVERLQPAVVNLGESGASVVGDGRQYLFVSVDVTDGDPPSRLDFAFRLGGRVYSPGVETAGRLHPATFGGPRYDAERGAGWLVFELPEAWTARHAALSLHGREWPVGDALRHRLAAKPPELGVEWTANVADAGEVRHEFAVSNHGDTDTRFVGLVTVVDTTDGPLATFSRRVPAGETVAWTTTTTDAGPAASYRLAWPNGERTEQA